MGDVHKDISTVGAAPTVVAVLVVAAVAAGCAESSPNAPPPRSAGEDFEPVGPVALMANAPRAESADRSRTAVHLGDRGGASTALVPDSKIRLDVGMKLESSSLRLSRVDVAVDDQRVTLSGGVPDLQARDRAEIIARAVTGVRGVDNELTVESFPESSVDAQADASKH